MKAIRERLWAIRWPLLVGCITVAGFALRVWSAWWNRYSPNGDFGIIALMAKHMAEGTDYPVFAYGTGYMGGPESILAALLGKLSPSGVTAFTVHLSTVVFGTLLLPLLYLFGREAGSRRAGVIAMLYCLVGSDVNFHHATEPRGGYMNMLGCGLLAVWLACRIVTREYRGERNTGWTYFWMGVAGGLAWWVTPLSVVFLFTVALVFLCGFRWRIALHGPVPALAGFVMGGLPWWIWNATHEWGTLEFGTSLGHLTFAEGIIHFRDLFYKLVELSPTGIWWHGVRFVLLMSLLAGFLALTLHDRLRHRSMPRFPYRLGLLLLAVVMVLSFCTSKYAAANARRYLLPLVPVVAVAIGVSADWLLTRYRFPWGWLLLVAVVPMQMMELPHLPAAVKAAHYKWSLAARLQKDVAPLCANTFLGNYYDWHWVNFATREAVCVAAMPDERYAPYARQAELTDARGYLNNYEGIRWFLHSTRGGSRHAVVDKLTIDYAVTPPPDNWRYVDAADVMVLRDQEGADCRAALCDANADTAWATGVGTVTTGTLTVAFNRTVALCGLRFLSPNQSYPHHIAIEGRTDARAPWQSLLPETKATEYFWSGPYVMLSGVQYVQEFRFAPPEGGVSEVRVRFAPWDGVSNPMALCELLCMEESPAPVAERPTVDRCLAALRAADLQQCYGPRWLAERLFVASSNHLATLVPSQLYRKIPDLCDEDSTQPYPLLVRHALGLFMDNRDVPRSRTVLKDAGLTWQETPLGSLTLLTVSAGGATADPRCLRVYWTELGCFSADNSKARAQALVEAVTTRNRGSGPADEVEPLRQALQLYPAHAPARARLVAALNAAGLSGEAATQVAALRVMTQPDVPAAIRFKGGLQFLGINVEPRTVARGQTLSLTYFWKCPPTSKPKTLSVFLHVEQGSHRFLDDHTLLGNRLDEDIRYQPFDEVFVESRRVVVPLTAPIGLHKVILGLFDGISGLRWPLETRLPHRKKAVELPVTVEITP